MVEDDGRVKFLVQYLDLTAELEVNPNDDFGGHSCRRDATFAYFQKKAIALLKVKKKSSLRLERFDPQYFVGGLERTGPMVVMAAVAAMQSHGEWPDLHEICWSHAEQMLPLTERPLRLAFAQLLQDAFLKALYQQK